MINERVEAHESLDEDVVDKDVAYLVKNSLELNKIFSHSSLSFSLSRSLIFLLFLSFSQTFFS